MSEKSNNKSWHDDLPFPKHWLGYIAIKVVVLGLLLLFALKYWALI